MTENITTKMPSLGILSPNQTNTQQAGKEFRSAIGEQKVAMGAVAAPVALVAIIAIALVACLPLVQNIIGDNKNGLFATPDDLDKLSRSLANLIQGNGKSDEFTPISKQLLNNPVIRTRIDKAIGGTIVRADLGKQGEVENTKAVFRSLYNQALQKSLANPKLTPKQRADLIALESYVFKAADGQANDGRKTAPKQGGENETGKAKKTGKLKTPQKPKKSAASEKFIKEITKSPNYLGRLLFFRRLFKQRDALQQLKQILEISKSQVLKEVGLIQKLTSENIANLERFIALAEKNFCSGKVPIKKDVIEMALKAERLGF
jgi:hypothetical protein